MKYLINGQFYTLDRAIDQNERRLGGFNALLDEVFGLSFENWRAQGYWTDKYRTYTLLDDEQVVANVSVSLMEMAWQGRVRRLAQLGTVMTAPAWRGRGLAGFLVNTALAEWQDRVEGIYLYANDRVLDFYPKFGFRPAVEYQAERSFEGGPGDRVRKLNPKLAADRELIRGCYQQSNPFSELNLVDNLELLMFYGLGPLKDQFHYLEDHRTLLIMDEEEAGFVCCDVFGPPGSELGQLLAPLLKPEKNKVRFGFALKDAPEEALRPIKDEDPLFVMGDGLEIFSRFKTRFPLCSHT